jgi:glycosyltransferase involved in cell wall biosynthesis
MRVVYLAAGAGGMICGSCLRDNHLVATLQKQGRDALLLPLYTPLNTDEPDVSTGPVLFGGLNVYLQQISPVFRRLPRFLTHWLDSPALLRLIGKRASATTAESLGPLTLSVLRGEHGRQAREVEAVVETLRSLQPDVVNLPNLLLIGLARRIREALNVPVLCTLSGEDLFIDALPEPWRGQAVAEIAARAPDVDAFIALTRYYGDEATRRFSLPAERVRYVPMGVAEAEFAPPTNAKRERDANAPLEVAYLARICPAKGLHNLVRAAATLKERGTRVRIRAAGWLGASDQAYFASVRRAVQESGLENDFEYLGAVDRRGKVALLHSADVFSVPADYAEAKGLSIIEALAAGLPVVQPAHGSYVEVVRTTGGGILVPPADPAALAGALGQLAADAAARRSLGEAAMAGFRAYYTDRHMADAAWEAYQSVRAARGTAAPAAMR